MKPDRYWILANGKKQWLTATTSVNQFLSDSGWKPTQVVVEHNGKVLTRSELDGVNLQEGDRLEIIAPVAGG